MGDYSQLLSNLVLAGSGFYCYAGVKKFVYARFSYAAIIANASMGLIRWAAIEGLETDRYYEMIGHAQDLIVLPCVVSTLWIKYRYLKEIALMNILFCLIPIATNLLEDKPISKEFKNTVVTFNIAALTAIALIHDNFSGLAAMAVYAFGHIELKKNNNSYFDMEVNDLYNYIISAFAVLSLQAITS